MSDHATIQLQDNILNVAGDLNFATTEALWRASLPLMATVSEFRFDLSGVHFSNSAGLALMLEWMRYAKEHKKSIQFQKIPLQLLSIARVAGVEEILQECSSA